MMTDSRLKKAPFERKLEPSEQGPGRVWGETGEAVCGELGEEEGARTCEEGLSRKAGVEDHGGEEGRGCKRGTA